MALLAAKVSQGLLKTLPFLRCVPQRTLSKRSQLLLPKQCEATLCANHILRQYSSAPKDEEAVAKRDAQQRAMDANFEPDPERASGKTKVNILNEETDEGIFFASYSCLGFRLSNGMRIMGPCAVFPRSILHWNVGGIKDICDASLRFFTLLEPKIDILILGVGERENLKKMDPAIIKFLRSHKINMEILSTDQALATFNFLNSEKRYVAAALIPPSFVEEDRFDDGDTRFTSLADADESKLFKNTTDYDYIRPGYDEGITEEMWNQKDQKFMEAVYQKEAREKDKLENPEKYRE